VRLIPVGDAMYLADTNVRWGYRPDRKFDFNNAQPTSLPDQTHSLHTGWRWTAAKDGKKSLTMDGHHASVAGQYLAACVFYEVLFAESVVGNSRLGHEQPRDQGERVARRASTGRGRLTNLTPRDTGDRRRAGQRISFW